jgi:hypothetical protein
MPSLGVDSHSRLYTDLVSASDYGSRASKRVVRRTGVNHKIRTPAGNSHSPGR